MYENDILRRMAALRPEQIRACRKELRLSQEGFATLIGRQTPGAHGEHPSVFSVSRWELGKGSPGLMWGPTLVRLVEESEARSAYKQGQELARVAALGAS